MPTSATATRSKRGHRSPAERRFGSNREESLDARRTRACNDATAELIERHPGRFGGFACLPLPDVEGSLREIEHAVDTLGLDGAVLLASQSDGRYLGDPAFEEVMAELDRRETGAFVHPAIPVSMQSIPVAIPAFAMEFDDSSGEVLARYRLPANGRRELP